jgi:hypothetical protein
MPSLVESSFRAVYTFLTLAGSAVACSSTSADPRVTETDAGGSPTAPGLGTRDAASPTTTGSGSYESNLSDFALTVADVLATREPARPKAAGFESRLTIRIVDLAGGCADLGAGVERANAKSIELLIKRTAPTAAESAITVGMYAFHKGTNAVTLERRTTTEACTASASLGIPFSAAEIAVNALVITVLDAKHVAGTYEVAASDGRSLKGAFDAELCGATTASTITCM